MEIFKYIKTGNLYTIINEVEMKNPITREWEKAYLYTPIQKTLDFDEIEKTKLYVRSKSDFEKRFKVVK
jgi:hypothetical protein